VRHFDSDDYYHMPTDPPFRVQRAPDERCAMLERDLAPYESWVLSGGAALFEPAPALHFTLIVFLHLPSDVRYERILGRERERYGPRIHAGGDMADDHVEFMRWTAGYDDSTAAGTNTLASHEAFLRRATCPVLRLTGALSTEDAVARVLSQLTGG
jgi:hypothetical protein